MWAYNILRSNSYYKKHGLITSELWIQNKNRWFKWNTEQIYLRMRHLQIKKKKIVFATPSPPQSKKERWIIILYCISIKNYCELLCWSKGSELKCVFVLKKTSTSTLFKYICKFRNYDNNTKRSFNINDSCLNVVFLNSSFYCEIIVEIHRK